VYLGPESSTEYLGNQDVAKIDVPKLVIHPSTKRKSGAPTSEAVSRELEAGPTALHFSTDPATPPPRTPPPDFL